MKQKKKLWLVVFVLGFIVFLSYFRRKNNNKRKNKLEQSSLEHEQAIAALAASLTPEKTRKKETRNVSTVTDISSAINNFEAIQNILDADPLSVSVESVIPAVVAFHLTGFFLQRMGVLKPPGPSQYQVILSQLTALNNKLGEIQDTLKSIQSQLEKLLAQTNYNTQILRIDDAIHHITKWWNDYQSYIVSASKNNIVPYSELIKWRDSVLDISNGLGFQLHKVQSVLLSQNNILGLMDAFAAVLISQENKPKPGEIWTLQTSRVIKERWIHYLYYEGIQTKALQMLYEAYHLPDIPDSPSRYSFSFIQSQTKPFYEQLQKQKKYLPVLHSQLKEKDGFFLQGDTGLMWVFLNKQIPHTVTEDFRLPSVSLITKLIKDWGGTLIEETLISGDNPTNAVDKWKKYANIQAPYILIPLSNGMHYASSSYPTNNDATGFGYLHRGTGTSCTVCTYDVFIYNAFTLDVWQNGMVYFGPQTLSEFSTSSEKKCQEKCDDEILCAGATFNPLKQYCWNSTYGNKLIAGWPSDMGYYKK